MKTYINGTEGQVQGNVGSSELVSIKNIAEMTGFPIEFIRDELLVGTDFYNDEGVPMDTLRSLMTTYLNTTMMASVTEPEAQ
ncbi:MAG: hypothetical protein U0T83_05375 [Bacteriovoracaceae bacterium]